MLELDKIYNMDCFESIDKISKNSIQLVLTDPPFLNPSAHYISRDLSKAKRCYGDTSVMKHSFRLLAKRISNVLKPNGHVLVFCDCVTYPVFFEAFYDYFDYTRALIWYKGDNYFSLGRGAWRYSYEMIMHSYNKNQFYVSLDRQDVIKCSNVKNIDRDHPAEKPVDLLMKLILAVTQEDDVVLDPFIGSGSTAVASKQLKRKFIGFEINPDYVNIANKKIENIPIKLEVFDYEN